MWRSCNRVEAIEAILANYGLPLDMVRGMTRALITGSTSGLGLEFAWQLAGAGHDLTLVARHEDRLAAVAAQIEAVSGVKVEVLAADLSETNEAYRVARRLTDPVKPINLLVNHSGHTVRSQFLECEVEEQVEQIDTMVRGTMILSHAAARAMVKKGHGAILNVSSLAGFTTTSVPAAAKSWITIFTEALALELEDTGVTATVLLPGFVHTESHENAAVNIEGIPRVTWMKAPFVVEQALKDCAAGEVVSVPSLAFRTETLGKATPRAVRRAFLSDRLAKTIANVRTARAQKAAVKRRFSRAPWAGKE